MPILLCSTSSNHKTRPRSLPCLQEHLIITAVKPGTRNRTYFISTRTLGKMLKLIKVIDFVEFSNRIDALGQFDQRLKHLLLNDQSLKSLDSDMKLLSDQLATTLDQSFSLQSFKSINANIAELQKDLKLLTSSPRPSPESSPSTDLQTHLSSF